MAWMPNQFRLDGGLNEEDPAFTLPPGMLTFCRNVECLPGGGYRRILGYERYDGRAEHPSAATYYSFGFQDGGPRPIVSGDVIVGANSGATAVIVGNTLLDNGVWLDLSATGHIGVAAVVGTFQDGERITIAGIDTATLNTEIQVASVEDENYKSWLGGARDYYRSLILAPVGGGAIRGGFILDNDVYCFRDDSTPTPTFCRLYRADSGGWVEVTLSDYLRFSTGTAEIFEGDTITGATSAATAVVRRVNIASGNYTGPTYASGRFVVTGGSGTFQNGENLQVGGVTKAVAVGVRTTATIQPVGRFETIVTNFYGASNLTRAYGVNGVGRAFEFDGTYFTFIETGMTVDFPNHIEKHRNHLFLSFPGGSLQNSGTGTPLVWSPRIGAAEIGIGDDITSVKSNGNNTLAVTGKKSLSILNGTSNLDWSLRNISDETGGVAYTMQESGGQTLFLDRAGINSIGPSALTGDIGTNAVSRNVRKTVERLAPYAVDSIHAYTKNQYRLWFSDMTGLVATYYGAKLIGFTATQFRHQISCSWSGTINGVETMFAGTDEGYVMQLDSGTSFDGYAIESIIQLPFCYYKYPDRDKRFHKITLEVDTPKAINLRLATDFDYGGGGQSGQFTPTPNPTGGIWDTSLWDEFYWDSAVLSAPEINIDGVGRNMGITIYHNDAVDASFIISAALVQLSLYGIRR